MFDLRSDTITRPTPAMRDAMARAEVGDDVFGEDPSVNALEREAARLCAKQAALFVPSGTMGNQICLGALAAPGSEVIAEASSHVLLNEVGSAARLWGVQMRGVQGSLGCMEARAVESLVRPDDIHYPPTAAISVENAHNYAGGTVIPLQNLDALAGVARRHGLGLHMDGARLFNAQVASGVPVARILRDVDLASICLSKGLGAPVGSLVVGDAGRLAVCRKLRKALGGGMRQAGVLAAAGLIALREGPAAMLDDHRRAARLARGLDELPGVSVDLTAVQTNIVFARVPGRAERWETALAARGVLSLALDPDRVRFVFHRDVDDDAVEAALEACTALAHG